jgi:hypothetical protein
LFSGFSPRSLLFTSCLSFRDSTLGIQSVFVVLVVLFQFSECIVLSWAHRLEYY